MQSMQRAVYLPAPGTIAVRDQEDKRFETADQPDYQKERSFR